MERKILTVYKKNTVKLKHKIQYEHKYQKCDVHLHHWNEIKTFNIKKKYNYEEQ